MLVVLCGRLDLSGLNDFYYLVLGRVGDIPDKLLMETQGRSLEGGYVLKITVLEYIPTAAGAE